MPILTAPAFLLASPAGAAETVCRRCVVAADTVWSGAVLIEGQAVVKKGATLTIDPGTTVRFAWTDEDADGIGDGELRVEGRLLARGTRERPGWIADRIGGVRTLLVVSALQAISLVLYLPLDSLWSLYVVSALCGLFQGGIVPSYAIIVREFFAPKEAGARVGVVVMATLFSMSLGGWMSGEVFDLTGSYSAAFVNGIAWNLLNLSIVIWLLRRPAARAVQA